MARKPREIPDRGFYVYTAPQGWSQYWLDGEKLWSVSKVKEAIGTGSGLQVWAARMERDAMLNAMEQQFATWRNDLLATVEKLGGAGLTLAAIPEAVMFRSAVQAALPKQLAFETYRDAQADIGRAAHELLEGWYHAYLRGEPYEPDLPEDVPDRDAILMAYKAAIGFLQEYQVVPLAAERPVYSRALHVGGRLDKIALVRGKPAVLDYKSSKRIHYVDRVTTAAYRMLYNDCPDKLAAVPRIDAALVLKLPKVAGEAVEPHAMGKEECDDLNRVFTHAAAVRKELDAAGVFDWSR